MKLKSMKVSIIASVFLYTENLSPTVWYSQPMYFAPWIAGTNRLSTITLVDDILQILKKMHLKMAVISVSYSVVWLTSVPQGGDIDVLHPLPPLWKTGSGRRSCDAIVNKFKCWHQGPALPYSNICAVCHSMCASVFLRGKVEMPEPFFLDYPMIFFFTMNTHKVELESSLMAGIGWLVAEYQ